MKEEKRRKASLGNTKKKATIGGSCTNTRTQSKDRHHKKEARSIQTKKKKRESEERETVETNSNRQTQTNCGQKTKQHDWIPLDHGAGLFISFPCIRAPLCVCLLQNSMGQKTPIRRGFKQNHTLKEASLKKGVRKGNDSKRDVCFPICLILS